MKSVMHLAVITLCAATLWGCDVDALGEEGNVAFRDQTQEPELENNYGFDRKLAKGATVQVRLSEPGLSAAQVTSSDPSVIEILAVDQMVDAGDEEPNGTLVTARGLEVGSAQLEVSLPDGRSDRATIEVAEVSSAEVEVYPWDPIIALDSNLWSQGMSMLPQTNLTIFGRMRDDSGNTLTGADALSFSVEGDGDASVEDDQFSDMAVYQSGETVGSNALRFGESEPFDLPTIAMTEVTRIEFAGSSDDLTVALDGALLLHVAFYTEDGRYVVGVGDQELTYSSDLEADFGRLAEDETIARAYRAGRATDFVPREVGTHVLTARWAELEATIEIEVYGDSEADSRDSSSPTTP